VLATVSTAPVDAVRQTRDQRGAGFGFERFADEIVAVALLALDRDVEIAFFERARVDGKPVHGERPGRMTQGRAFGFRRCPQDAHVRRSAA